jgi:hypothetical protein
MGQRANDSGEAQGGARTARGVTIARRLVGGLVVVWVVALAVAFAMRVGFPLELEWMEGGIVHQAHRLQQGQPIYPPPSADFVPFLYTPLYPMVLAVLGFVFPLGLPLGRIVSIVAWVAIGLGLRRAVLREAKPQAHAIAAMGLWCASYVFTFRWIDLCRPDTLFLALTLWGLVLLRESWGDAKKAALAGLLMALAFWTKQTAAVPIIASGIAGLLVAPRQLWIYVAVIAVVDGGGMLLGNAITDGWLWTYVYELHQAHAFNAERFARKTWGMFAHAAPFLVVLAAWMMIDRAWPWLARKRRLDVRSDEVLRARLHSWRALAYWGIVALAGLLASALGYATQWAEPNAFMPGVAFAALWIGVALPLGGRREIVALGLVAAQLVLALVVEPMYQPVQTRGLAGLTQSWAWQDLARTVPNGEKRERAGLLREHLEASRGRVFALHRPYWSMLAGGDGHVGSMGLSDVHPPERREIERELGTRITAGEYDELWFEGEPPGWLRPALRGYAVVERLQGAARVRPMSGWMSEAGVVTPYTADQIRMAPIAAREVPLGAEVIADFEDGTTQGFVARAGFAGRPVRGFAGELPQPAGYGGEFWLSSAGARGKLDERGQARSPTMTLAAGNTIELLVAWLGARDGLALTVIDEQGVELAELPLPASPAVMQTVMWQAPAPMTVRIVAVDATGEGAIAIDDVWRR